MEASKHRYLIALGSNRRAPQIGAPRAVLDAAVAELAEEGWEETLEHLQSIEEKFGRERRGQRWRARTLDLDIVLWSGGAWHSTTLSIPHPLFREREFVLRPAAEIAADWRDPVSGHTLRQLARRSFR